MTCRKGIFSHGTEPFSQGVCGSNWLTEPSLCSRINTLVCVRFEPGTDDTINVTIALHEVKIAGKNLRELALAFQKFTVDWVKELPPRYAAAANGEGVHIASIAVTKIQAHTTVL